MKYQNYITTSLFAVLAYYWGGFNFIDYIIFLIITAFISVFIIAFGGGEKIAYTKLAGEETNLAHVVAVDTSTTKYLGFTLPILVILSILPFFIMNGINSAFEMEYYPIHTIHFEILGFIINLVPFFLNIFLFKDTKKYLTNVKNKYFFVLSMSAFIPVLIPFDILRVIIISLLFAYATDMQGHKKQDGVTP